ncbi:MAG: tRNA (cytidine(34)-2'-O)-methyltransferase [Tepidisphaeraceae bacterium]|jgi:tRNA (cytidine/uridine-2'-O-)-methyltransferase
MTDPLAANLRPHRLKVALLSPQIAPNTGNIARACVATGTEMHLVRPLGFVLSDKNLRRSAMDYWPRLRFTVHDDSNAFFGAARRDAGTIWLFSSTGCRSLWQTKFTDGDWLVFGSETSGIAPTILAEHPARIVRIPQMPDERCLNLSAAAAIALFEALRQIQSDTMSP